jgi:hypothetical protein
MLQRGILVVKSKYNKSHRTYELLAQWLDYQLQPISEPQILMEQEVQSYGDKGNFRVRISDDEQRIAVITSKKNGSDSTEISWSVFTDSMQRVEYHTHLMNWPFKKLQLNDFLVNNEGQVFSIFRQWLKDRRKDANHIDYFMAQRGDSVYVKSFIDSVHFRNLGLSYQRDKGLVVLAGFYGEPGMSGSIGVCYYSYDGKTGEEVSRFARFGEELADDLNIGRRNQDVIPDGFEFLKLVPRSDGGLICVAEQKDIDTENEVVMMHGIPTSTSKNIYNFNDILVLNLDSTGAIEWSEVIHKNQTTVNDGGYFSSAIVFVNADYLQIIYNDQIRNSGEVMQHTILSNGKSFSRKLLKSELDYVVIIPAEATQVSSNKIIIPSAKNRRFALLKLIYN